MDTQEFRLAVLHKIVSESGDIGKTGLQKLGYLLQEALGVPTEYSFRMHHYGPYAESLETDAARLKLTGYVDIQPDQAGYGFHITPLDKPLEEWSQLIGPYSESIDRVMTGFGDWKTHELELAATIHFVKNLLPDSQKDQVILNVRALKPKFDDGYISSYYGKLEDLGLLEG